MSTLLIAIYLHEHRLVHNVCAMRMSARIHSEYHVTHVIMHHSRPPYDARYLAPLPTAMQRTLSRTIPDRHVTHVILHHSRLPCNARYLASFPTAMQRALSCIIPIHRKLPCSRHALHSGIISRIKPACQAQHDMPYALCKAASPLCRRRTQCHAYTLPASLIANACHKKHPPSIWKADVRLAH